MFKVALAVAGVNLVMRPGVICHVTRLPDIPRLSRDTNALYRGNLCRNVAINWPPSLLLLQE